MCTLENNVHYATCARSRVTCKRRRSAIYTVQLVTVLFLTNYKLLVICYCILQNDQIYVVRPRRIVRSEKLVYTASALKRFHLKSQCKYLVVTYQILVLRSCFS